MPLTPLEGFQVYMNVVQYLHGGATDDNMELLTTESTDHLITKIHYTAIQDIVDFVNPELRIERGDNATLTVVFDKVEGIVSDVRIETTNPIYIGSGILVVAMAFLSVMRGTDNDDGLVEAARRAFDCFKFVRVEEYSKRASEGGNSFVESHRRLAITLNIWDRCPFANLI